MTDKRLLKLADVFTERKIYDIGSDHGYLPLYLLKNKKVDSAVILEINEQPLKNAQNNLRGFEQVEYILSDGLCNYDKEVTGGVVIAGMGGSLISKIIDDSREKLKNSTLYLQPNNKEDVLRRYLTANKFKIEEEWVIKENKRLYFVLKVTNNVQSLSEEEIILGKNVFIDEHYYEKMNDFLKHYTNIYSKLQENNLDNDELKNKIKYINTLLGE